MSAILSLLLACGGGDLVLRDTFDTSNKPTGPGTTTSPPSTSSLPGAQDCPWVGTWALQSARCGAENFNTWQQTYSTTSLEMRHNREKGCDVVLTLANERCTEVATWWTEPDLETDPTSGQTEMGKPPQSDAMYGTTACEPESCKLANGSPECTIGDHQSEQVVLWEQPDPNQLSFVFLASYAAPSCADLLRLFFVKE